MFAPLDDMFFCNQDPFSPFLSSASVQACLYPLFAELGQKKSHGGGNFIWMAWFNMAGWCLRVESGTLGVGTINEMGSGK